MSCLSDFWKLLLVDSLTALQMAEPTGRLHLDSQMYSLTKESQFVIESFQILKEITVRTMCAILCKAKKQMLSL